MWKKWNHACEAGLNWAMDNFPGVFVGLLVVATIGFTAWAVVS